MSTYRIHPYQRTAKETSRLMLRLGNGCDEVMCGNRVTQEVCAKASRTIAHVTPRRNLPISIFLLVSLAIENRQSKI
jgi:hypothetical protein